MKVIFFGTPLFAVRSLELLLECGIEVAAVVTRPDQPKGRSGTPTPPPVAEYIQRGHPEIPVYQPLKASDPGFYPLLQRHRADLFVVVAYGEILKQELLDLPKIGCVNLHASLLPKYRGAAPIQWALIRGEKESGVSIIHMARKMDAGDLIKQAKVDLPAEITAGELQELLCILGSETLVEALRELERGEASRIPQEDSLATFAPKIELEECRIDWSRSAEEIHNLVRGTNPAPGAWSPAKIRGKERRVKILRTKVEARFSGPPGTLAPCGERPVVCCGRGALELLQIQLEGKRAMPAAEAVKGLPLTDWAFDSLESS